jgi:uncharacterized protein
MTKARPLPVPDAETAPYWNAAAQGRLVIQKCSDCGAFRFYPRLVCPSCMSEKVEWVEASGRGRVYSYTIVHRAPPAFRDDAPYVVVVVELEEGVRLMSRLDIDPPGAATIDMPVKVTFEKISDDITLPHFVPA